MIITDDTMRIKMKKALSLGGDLFTMDDIDKYLCDGRMQGHVVGNSWAITQVHDWPKCRTINVLFVVGDIEDAPALDKKIEEWAISVGAKAMTAVGRDGWWGHRTPGWGKMGVLYSKDI